VEVTPNAYAKRAAQLARLLSSAVRPDVIAFQEVSGTLAVTEALGSAAPDYHVCSFDGAYKVQRLAFAWKRTLGNAPEACSAVHALSLPALPKSQQVRPGYALTLELAGKRVRFMTVHLKAGCVTPKDGHRLDGNSGPNDPCPTLQRQVAPLEAAWEALASDVDHFIVLGDFNRNLWHEANLLTGAEAIRSDGHTDLAEPRAAGVLTRNLLVEVNDGVPSRSEAVLLSVVCAGKPAVTAACEKSKVDKLTSVEAAVLIASEGLGCRNPVGLDHVLVSKSLAAAVRSTSKISIGPFGRSLSPRPPDFPDPLLAVSDHCPVVVEIEL
jgi:endonuclease/exonuclease/phosphatase family metal-dependent hydrolase